MTVANAQPAWWRVPLGSRLLDWGEGVGDCRGAVVLRSGVPFGSPTFFCGEGKLCSFFWDKVFSGCIPLSIPVTNEEPTSGHRDVCSVRIPNRALGVKTGRCMVRPQFLPRVFLSFWLPNGPSSFLVGWWSGCHPLVRPGPTRSKGVPCRLTVEFVNVGGWLTHCDLALNFCSQFCS